MPFSCQLQLPILPVGGFWAVLALIVVFANVGCQSAFISSELNGSISKACDELEQVGVFNSRRRRLPPGKRRVACNQYPWNRKRIQTPLLEKPGDDHSRVEYVGFFHFFFR